MAFWGVEVKSGKPFTHNYDESKGRLHISMATLGFGSTTAKSTLQCNVGNRSPVYLCSLYPGNTESLQLNLELEEVDQVVFSVIGPRSIHLCGYYLARSRNTNIIDESESFGEDIADTESGRTNYSDEDEYEDSFIDDNADPEVFPSSPISNEDEASLDNGPKGKKSSLRRLRKKYQSVESDNDDCIEEKKIVNDSMHDQSTEIDSEDGRPISSVYKKKTSQRILDPAMDDGVDSGAGDAGNENGDVRNSNIETNSKSDHVHADSQTHRETKTMDKILPSSQINHGQSEKPKKKRKERSKEGTTLIANGAYDNNPVNLPQRNQHNITVNEGVEISDYVALPSAETDPEKSRTKRKKKEHAKKGSFLQGDYGCHESIIQEFKANRDTTESHDLSHQLFEAKDQSQKLTNVKSADNAAHDFPDGNQSGDKKTKKKKKKSKNQDNVEVVNSDLPVSVEQCNEIMENGSERAGSKPSEVRTLSNGLVIQELEMGTKDGKIAASGKKISIYYTGKLKENGVVFDSNAGQAPFKFRLGKGEVIKGWDVGLEGMQVGEKRRLVIPPSMTSMSDGHSAQVPPNSWLVYDFQLVKVH